MRMALARVAVSALAILSMEGARAAYSTVFGEDLNVSATDPLTSTPIASAAESFFAALLTGVGTETFEGQTTGETAPLALTFPGTGGNITATLAGGDGVVDAVTPGQTDGFGRYSIPALSSSRFWAVTVTDGSGAGPTADFTVTFSKDVAAFGFYGVDIGDFDGSLIVELFDSNNSLLTTLSVPNSLGFDGSVLFFGAIAGNAAESFRSLRFLTSTSGSLDTFAFDNFTVADATQAGISPPPTVPEPGTLALLGLGLAGLAAARRRKH